MCVYVCVCVCVHACVCVSICICVCVVETGWVEGGEKTHLCVRVCVFACVCVCASHTTNTRTHTHTHTARAQRHTHSSSGILQHELSTCFVQVKHCQSTHVSDVVWQTFTCVCACACTSIPRRTSAFWRIRSEIPGFIFQLEHVHMDWQTCGARRRTRSYRPSLPRAQGAANPPTHKLTHTHACTHAHTHTHTHTRTRAHTHAGTTPPKDHVGGNPLSVLAGSSQ